MSSVARSFSFKRLIAIGRPFWVSSMKYKAFGLLACVLAVLKLVKLEHLPLVYGGLNVPHAWRDKLSPGEQQRLSFARVLVARPQFVSMDEGTSALDDDNEALLYTLLSSIGATVVSIGHRSTLLQHHASVLRLTGDGGWRLEKATG